MSYLQEVKKILKQEGIYPKKYLGQNFIISKKILEDIIRCSNVNSQDTVLEIGSGIGTLTEMLLGYCKKVIAVEKDKKMVKVLRKNLSHYDNLEIICADILKIDLEFLVENIRIKIIGNLPYYISSNIIKYIIDNKERIFSAYFSFQKEFAQRLQAEPGSKEYGRLTLLTHYHFLVNKLFDIEKEFFYPVPKIDSSFIRLYVRSKSVVEVQDEKFLFRLIKVAFSSRRKKLINCIMSNFEFSRAQLVEKFKKINLDPHIRGEELDLNDFARLSEILYPRDRLN